MSVKLIAVDLDGTLLNDDKQMTEENRTALISAADKGIEIVPTTGRNCERVPLELIGLPFVRFLIGVNGGRIYDLLKEKVLFKADISLDTVEEILDYLDGLPIICEFFQDGKTWLPREHYNQMEKYIDDPIRVARLQKLMAPIDDFRETLRRRNLPVQKLQIIFNDMDLRAAELIRIQRRFPGLNVSYGLSNVIELNDKEASKGNALKILCGCLGISCSDVLAIGDGTNDISMFEVAGIGIAMGNAFEEVKRCATDLTDGNDENGVAKAIEKYI